MRKIDKNRSRKRNRWLQGRAVRNQKFDRQLKNEKSVTVTNGRTSPAQSPVRATVDRMVRPDVTLTDELMDHLFGEKQNILSV